MCIFDNSLLQGESCETDYSCIFFQVNTNKFHND